MRASVQVDDGSTQRLIDAWLQAHAGQRRAILLEGLFAPVEVPADVPLERLAGGCVCCLGQVPLRVALVRLVRALRPETLLLVLAGGDHAARVKALLADGSLGVRFTVE
jgi:hypothetical protein